MFKNAESNLIPYLLDIETLFYALTEREKTLVLGLILVFIVIPFAWLLLKNFGKVLVFILAFVGIFVLVAFGAFWIQIYANS